MFPFTKLSTPVRRILFAACCCLLGVAVRAQSSDARAGVSEAGLSEMGVPNFVVLGPEALGMSSSPVDLLEMPDGRLMVVGRSEIVFGDGVRWVLFQRADGAAQTVVGGMVAAPDGSLYASVPGGFSKLVFDEHARWHCQGFAALPSGMQLSSSFSHCIKVGGEWLWTWGSGPVIRWKPGQTPQLLGSINAPERAFLIGGRIHVSDSSTGALFRVEGDSLRTVVSDSQTYVDRTVLCSVVLPGGGDLLGTRGRGLMWTKDGVTRNFSDNPLLSGEQRIQDLASLGDGLYVAAVDTVGLVFFNEKGRVIQVLDRSLDHRLAHIRHIVKTRHGVLWTLLDEGLLRVAFPSRTSHLEPLVASGLNYAVPYRFGGRLWLMSDGRAQRGVYDERGRLLRMELDTPDTYLCSMSELYGHLLACGRSGIFVRGEQGGWSPIAAGVASAHIRPGPVGGERWLYVARDETGWLRYDRGSFSVTRIPVPGLGEPYGAVTDSEGVFWIELGTGRLARIEPSFPKPTVEIFGLAEGLPNGWVQAFVIDGRARVNAGGRIMRLDAVSKKWIEDRDMLSRFPELEGAEGRPARDSQGRLWVTRNSGIVVRDSEAAHLLNKEEKLPSDLRPLYFTSEPGGVMWMQQQMRLVRYDPSMPRAPDTELRAVISQVQLPMSDRILVPRDGHVDELRASDQSMIVHFQAPGVPLGQAVSFEVLMEGLGEGWVSTGSTGTAAFSRLGPGEHVLHVRPRCDGMPGGEAILSFHVLAPWYRTPAAYAGYGVLGCLLGWLSWWLPRREKQRLAMMVAVRTAELNSRNADLNHALRDSLAKASALKLSEDRYRRLSENAPDVIFRLHLQPEPAFDYLSPAIEKVTGHAPEAFYARPSLLADITHPPGSPTLLDLARQGRLKEGMRELCWLGANGDQRHIEERLVLVRDASGGVTAVEGIARDVTERKASEGLIRTLSQAVDQSPAGVMIIDLSGTIIFANPRMGGILGYEHNELISRSLRQLEVEIARPELVERLWTAMAIGNSWKGELAVKHREGRVVHLRLTFSPLKDALGMVQNYLAMGEDISQWKEDQERKRRLEAQLFQSQKLESLGTLAGGIAHDFNNILTGILGFCELADSNLREGLPMGEELAEVRKAGLRAKDLVSRMLAFSRQSESKPVFLDLSKAVDEALRLVRASTPTTIEIRRELEPGQVRADPTQVHQVVLNLCTNAVHAMGDKAGVLSVSVQPALVGREEADEIAGLVPGSYFRLSVSDTGHGMDEATLGRIFDPFFTTKKPGEGTGLGLAVVRGIVANHKGALSVRSTPGRGTVFDIYLPAAEGTGAPAAESAPMRAEGGRGEEILVVDDELQVANFIAASLRKANYRAHPVTDARDALELMKAAPSRFAAVVTDLTMPHLTGVELITRLREIAPGLPAVIVTGYSRDLTRQEAMLLRQSVSLGKPFTGPELVQALGSLLRQHDGAGP